MGYILSDSDVCIQNVCAKWYIVKLYQNAKSHAYLMLMGPMIIDLKIFRKSWFRILSYLDTFPFYDGKGNFL